MNGKKLFKSISHIDFELSSICNAKCPVCPRSIQGEISNFVQTYYTLDDVKKIFDESIIKNLTKISVCGNFGDGMANPDISKIMRWFKYINPLIEIQIATNGSIGEPNVYKELGEIGCNMVFAIDGYGESNELYRVNTKWKNIDTNIKCFLETATPSQFNVQYIAWLETISQIIPIIDYIIPLGCNDLWIRSPFTQNNGIVKVYDIKNKSSHLLTMPDNNFLDILDTHWGPSIYINGTLDNLRDKIIKMNIRSTPIINLEGFKPIYNNVKFEYRKSNFNLTTEEVEEYTKISKVDCLSLRADGTSCLFITHDGYLMPCCIIASYLPILTTKTIETHNNLYSEVLNKILDIGLDKFNLKDKTIYDIFDSGVMNDFVYDSSLFFCKKNCGIK